MDPIKVDFSGKGKAKELLIPPEKAGLKIVINIVLTVIVAVVGYYFLLPPMNLKAIEFYYYIALILAAYIGATFITSKAFAKPEYIPYVKRRATVPVIIALVFALILGVGYLTSCVLFRAKAYSKIINVSETVFGDDASITTISDIEDFKSVPLIDKDVAYNLGNKKLGELSDWVSQFIIDEPYSTQINYRGAPTRVLPLKYGDVFKWLNNRSSGIPAYITVNMYTQDADAVIVEGGIKYSTSEYFNRKLMRVLRFAYPTYMFGSPSLEIDEDGNPIWVCERIDKTIGLIGGEDVIGLVTVDAVTGETTYYTLDEVRAADSPIAWVDQVYSADLLIKQYNYYGKYINGFFNSFIGQSGVKITTMGYSYLANGDDVWMYTGVTSITNDDSIIGFALINQRTKEAVFQKISGTTEAGAQSSAKGIVSDKGWDATFPLLLNINGQATYFMALKDSNVVKSYAMVSVERVQDAVRSPADDNPDLVACLKSYESKLSSSGITLNFNYNGVTSDDEIIDSGSSENDIKLTGVVTDIRSAVVNGNTVYYIRLDGGSAYYSISAATEQTAVLVGVGSTVEVSFAASDAAIVSLKSLKIA